MFCCPAAREIGFRSRRIASERDGRVLAMMDVASGSVCGAKALGMYLEERVTEVLLLQAWTFKLYWLKARLRGVF